MKSSAFHAWRRHYRWATPLIVALATLTFAPDLLAQAEGAAEEPATKSLLDQITDAGIWMVPLIICSMAAVALVVFNAIQLTRSKFAPPELKAQLMDHMAACQVRSAIEVSATSPSYLGRMMAYSLPHVDATEPETMGRERVEDHMADFTVKENRGHMTWIGYFSIIAQASPMLGLLGTVVGMIKAFATMGTSGGADPSLLAGDISLALITTASGLVIAIPSLVGYFFFRNRLNNLVSECHDAGAEMLDSAIMAVNADQHMAKVPEGVAVQ